MEITIIYENSLQTQLQAIAYHICIIYEKIEEIRNQRPESIAEVSPNDALSIVLGPEHSGRVQGLDLGVVPTMAFKQTSRRFNHVNVTLSSTTAPARELKQEVKSMKSQLNVLLTLYQRT